MAVKIINSYTNTDELLEQFQVKNPTPVTTQMEKDIQNRLLTGFANWNEGYEAWEEWGNILYTDASLYNLYGVHMTFPEYQMSQKAGLSRSDIQLGDFENMLVCGDWCAIRYSVDTTDRQTGDSVFSNVMEFVKFDDLGPELGTRVNEGWASTRGPLSDPISYFLTDDEKAAQQAAWAVVEAYQVPDVDDLAQKYPVKNPTPDSSDYADEIRDLILNDFDAWNSGLEAWLDFVAQAYADDFAYQVAAKDPIDLDGYKELAMQLIPTTERLYFDSMLVSGDWAAIHYRIVRKGANGSREAGDVMRFMKFQRDGDSVRMVGSWNLY